MSAHPGSSTPAASGAVRAARAGVRAEFIPPADPRWRELLERVPHDVYHLPEYAEVSSSLDQGHPLAFLAESGRGVCLIPLILRQLPEHLAATGRGYDVTSPYGYPGALCTDPTDTVMLERYFTAFRELGAERGVVSAFIRLHPLLPLSPAGIGTLGSVETHGRVVLVDLRRPTSELWAETRENHRTGIRKLARSGYVATMDAWEAYPEFVRLYEATMRRVGASPFYFFPAAYHDALRTRLGDRVHLCTVTAPDGRVACAGLFFEEGGIVQYHLGGTADEFLSVAPSKLMFHFVRGWARDRDNHVFHLGGGSGGREDSLFHFKAGFSPLRAEFQSVRVVLDHEQYRLLTRPVESASADVPGYFPAYRAPGLRAVP